MSEKTTLTKQDSKGCSELYPNSWFYRKEDELYYLGSQRNHRWKVFHKNTDRPPTPEEFAALLNHVKNKDMGLHDDSARNGIYYEMYNEPNTNSVALPNGHFDFVSMAGIGSSLMQKEIIEEQYIHLGETQSNIEEDLDTFLKSKHIYKSIGHKHKRGYLLYGKPGDGKTSMIKSIINRISEQQDVIVVHINSEIMPDSGICKVLNEDPRIKIFVFEEIVQQTQHSGHLKRLLDFLDGNQTIDNVIYFATTNYNSMLPENVAARPGRFDIVVQIDSPDFVVRHALMNFYLNEEVESHEDIDVLDGLSVACIKEVCIQSRLTDRPIAEVAEDLKQRIENSKKDFASEHKEIGFI